ncbi:hypothetical protein VZT92_018685 [Zoarces viviparus]|uniref:Uncharacterized protein n=1 Tax=Zoarces viviparus TaxID=48416 RepID=A0AAW1EIL6_ZOAVI
MKYRAGFLTVACAWMVVVIQSLDAGPAPQKHAAGVLCNLKALTALTRYLVDESLKGFDNANGEHLGTWSPGFPELEVHQHSTLDGPKVQCSLLFMAQGLKKVLEDQRDNLNPNDVSLHEELKYAFSKVNMLAVCAKHILSGECSPKPPPPKMPKHVFGKKQWSHTLLKTAWVYLDWLERKLGVQTSKIKGKNKIKRKSSEATLQKYLEGSGYLL